MGRKMLTLNFPSSLMAVLVLVAVATGQEEPELKLVNVVFRHGDRAPDPAETYANDPYLNYSFYPMGHGGLTNEGKLRVYRLGQELRSRYDNFLSPIYESNAIEARSTDYDRTKMSLQLVLSGLYPPAPSQQWNEQLLWQPIPAIYRRSHEDILLEPELCPKYVAELERVRKSPEALAKTSTYNGFLEFLTAQTGTPFKNTWDIWNLYHTLMAERSMNLTLPDWTADSFPTGDILDGASLEYEIVSFNQVLKRLNGGMLVRKITEDINAHKSGSLPAGRKLYLYSGHETNIGALLTALGLFRPHVPAYSSAIMIELWQLRKEYFVKVLYYSGIPAEVKTKTIPGCSELCPLDTLLEIVRPIIPSDSDLICVKKNVNEIPSPNDVIETLRNRIAL